MKWRRFDRRVSIKLKGKFYRTAIRPTMLYGTMVLNVRLFRRNIFHKIGVVQMRMLRWISGTTWKDKIRNEEICLNIGVASIDEKMKESRLRWFDHVQRRAINVPIRKNELIQAEGTKEGRGR